MSARHVLLQISFCIVILNIFAQGAKLSPTKPVKTIRISPTSSSYTVNHLTNYEVPELRQNSKSLYACNSTETPNVSFPQEGAVGEVVFLNLNGCSSVTDDECTYDVYGEQNFTYQMVFKAGGVSQVPRFRTEGSYTYCGPIVCLNLWFDLIRSPIEFPFNLTAGEYYGINYVGFLEGNQFDEPSFTFETWAAVGDYECSPPEYDLLVDDQLIGAGIQYDECPPGDCFCDEGKIGAKMTEDFSNMETCFKTRITYHNN